MVGGRARQRCQLPQMDVRCGGDAHDQLAGVGLAVTYRITRWLSAVGAYRFNHSETRGVSTDHSVLSIGLQTRYPTRLDD